MTCILLSSKHLPTFLSILLSSQHLPTFLSAMTCILLSSQHLPTFLSQGMTCILLSSQHLPTYLSAMSCILLSSQHFFFRFKRSEAKLELAVFSWQVLIWFIRLINLTSKSYFIFSTLNRNSYQLLTVSSLILSTFISMGVHREPTVNHKKFAYYYKKINIWKINIKR